MVDWVYVEPVASKATSDVLTAVGRMYAAARSEGFDVRRIHSDRGREYYDASMRTWCARHGLHRTFALPEEHQSNGRAQGAIMRVKSCTRVLLQEAGCEPAEWPLASKLAAHAMRNHARRSLNMKAQPTLPYNSKVQILQRSWNRGVWESVTTTARTKGPSSDSSTNWIVKTSEGKLLTTGTMFPAPREDQKLEFMPG